MSLPPADDRLLSRALDLAAHALGLASPNPTVGCVLAREEAILGEGAHHYDAFDHAEIAALKQASARGESISGATAYVTLEPCSHHGRTGPCADALIAAGIARCVIATVDPNPLVSGKGIARLRAAGVEVLLANPTSAPAQRARSLNDAFAFSIQHGRPFVSLKAALSVDGMLAPAPASRAAIAPHWLTGEAARADAQHLRHAADAIVTGIGTVLADDPSLTDRTGLARRRPLLRVVLDSDLRIPLHAKLVASAANDVLIFCVPHASSVREVALRQEGVEVHRLPDCLDAAPDPTPDATVVLAALHARNIRSVLLEAGSTLNGSFLRANLVDKLVLYYSESELGIHAVPFAQGFPSPFLLQQQLQRSHRITFPHAPAEDIRITGYLHDPWRTI